MAIDNALLEIRKEAVVASMQAGEQRKSVVAKKFDAFLRDRLQGLRT